jgi:hypothetical protein
VYRTLGADREIAKMFPLIIVESSPEVGRGTGDTPVGWEADLVPAG